MGAWGKGRGAIRCEWTLPWPDVWRESDDSSTGRHCICSTRRHSGLSLINGLSGYRRTCNCLLHSTVRIRHLVPLTRDAETPSIRSFRPLRRSTTVSTSIRPPVTPPIAVPVAVSRPGDRLSESVSAFEPSYRRIPAICGPGERSAAQRRDFDPRRRWRSGDPAKGRHTRGFDEEEGQGEARQRNVRARRKRWRRREEDSGRLCAFEEDGVGERELSI